MSRPTHSTLTHFRALVHRRRALAWGQIKAASQILQHGSGYIRHVGKAY